MNTDTANIAVRSLVTVLSERGVTLVVACPGSRNAPLLMALEHNEDISVTMVTDERVASFVALGMAVEEGRPVAVVCTSGTAVLNMAPAVAEAYYRKVALIVISADRPLQWIDQDDSQTIHQPGVLGAFVKRSYDLPSFDSPEMRWMINRTANDAVTTSLAEPVGPVHINLQIAEPIGAVTEATKLNERLISSVRPDCLLSDEQVSQLAAQLVAPRKVIVVAGFHRPDRELETAVKRLACLENVAVLTETISNIHGEDFVSEIDVALSATSDSQHEDMTPDLVITTGGALVSRKIKEYVRRLKNVEHWHVGPSHTTVDCFRHLTLRVDMDPAMFFKQLVKEAERINRRNMKSGRTTNYRSLWLAARDAGRSRLQSFCSKAQWSDLKAFHTFIGMIPGNVNIHYSNGTAVRYGQLFGWRQFHRCDCNRGVSGIDGATSTALGASLVCTDRITLLVTGDMSAQYDLGALASGLLTPRFKIIVLCNGGGGIFHFIKSTQNLDIANKCFDEPCCFPAKGIAETFGMSYFEATDEDMLKDGMVAFMAENRRAAMLAIYTSGRISGKTLTDFFAFCRAPHDELKY